MRKILAIGLLSLFICISALGTDKNGRECLVTIRGIGVSESAEMQPSSTAHLPPIQINDRLWGHITGDFTNQVYETSEGRKSRPALKGGMHTFESARQFLDQRSDIQDVLFQSTEHVLQPENSWFQMKARNAKGVIYLRLPESAYAKAARKNLEQTNRYRRNGRLWKTLFPAGSTRESIETMANEALANLTEVRLEGGTGHVIGLAANPKTPGEQISVRINYRNGQPMTIFPSWEQPNYNSAFYIEETSTTISYSTSQAIKEVEELGVPTNKVFAHYRSLLPPFIKASVKKLNNENVWLGKTRQLKQQIRGLSPDTIDKVMAFATDPIVRTTPHIIAEITNLDPRISDQHLVSDPSYNVYESVKAAATFAKLYDEIHGTNHFQKLAVALIKSRVTTRHVFDSVEIRRLWYHLVRLSVSSKTSSDSLVLLDIIKATLDSPVLGVLNKDLAASYKVESAIDPGISFSEWITKRTSEEYLMRFVSNGHIKGKVNLEIPRMAGFIAQWDEADLQSMPDLFIQVIDKLILRIAPDQAKELFDLLSYLMQGFRDHFEHMYFKADRIENERPVSQHAILAQNNILATNQQFLPSIDGEFRYRLFLAATGYAELYHFLNYIRPTLLEVNPDLEPHVVRFLKQSEQVRFNSPDTQRNWDDFTNSFSIQFDAEY